MDHLTDSSNALRVIENKLREEQDANAVLKRESSRFRIVGVGFFALSVLLMALCSHLVNSELDARLRTVELARELNRTRNELHNVNFADHDQIVSLVSQRDEAERQSEFWIAESAICDRQRTASQEQTDRVLKLVHIAIKQRDACRATCR